MIALFKVFLFFFSCSSVVREHSDDAVVERSLAQRGICFLCGVHRSRQGQTGMAHGEGLQSRLTIRAYNPQASGMPSDKALDKALA